MTIAVLMLAATWLMAFSSWRLRTWRATAVLVVGSAITVAATLLPTPIGPVAVGGAWIVLTLLVLKRSEALSAVSDREHAFIRTYADLLAGIGELKGSALGMEPASYLEEFERLTNAVERLDAPSSEWAELKAETVRELQRRSTIMRLGTRPATDLMARANEAWAAVEARFQEQLETRKSFWAPRLRPGPQRLDHPDE